MSGLYQEPGRQKEHHNNLMDCHSFNTLDPSPGTSFVCVVFVKVFFTVNLCMFCIV